MTDLNILTARGACYKHTRQRLQERYGITITASEYKELCRSLARDWRNLRWQPAPNSEYCRIKVKYPVQGKMVLFVFSPNVGLIVTAILRKPKSRPKNKGTHQISEETQRKAKSPRRRYCHHSKSQKFWE